MENIDLTEEEIQEILNKRQNDEYLASVTMELNKFLDEKGVSLIIDMESTIKNPRVVLILNNQ